MRYLPSLKWLAFVMILVSQAVIAQTNYTISGLLKDTKEGTVTLTVDRNWTRLRTESISVSLKDGQFVITNNLDRNRIVELTAGSIRLPLYAEPGDHLNLEVSGPPENTIALSGTGAEQNRFLQQFFTQFAADYNDSLCSAKMLGTGIDAFENDLFVKRKAQLDALKAASEKEKFSSGFVTFIQNQILYHYWQQLLAFPIINANSSKNILTVNPLPAVMLEELDKVTINNDPALICDSYRDFLKYYVIYFTSKANGFNKFNDPSISADRKQAVARDQLKGNCYLYWLSRYLLEECPNLSPFMVKKMQSLLKEADAGNKFYRDVKEYTDAHTTAHPEQTSGNAGVKEKPAGGDNELDLVDLNGKTVSLSDFKGKVVYIDFWASWCGPCRMMMPYSKQLHEKLDAKQKKEIVFLYISIDASKEAWQKAIQDLGIEGTHANSPGNWSSRVCRYFQINSIPRYMIMNKKGDVVDFNAKRPADPELLNDLLKYVSQ